jgi:Replicative DNA helicase
MFSLEMSNEQLVQRMIAQDTGINTQELRSGKIQDDHWDILTQSMENLSNSKIYLDDTPALTPIQMRTKCRRLHLEHHIDLILVDYIQLMSGDTRNDNRVQEVSYISRNLKTLARELNVPVLAAAQLSRAVEQRTDKKPMLSDLRESGSLEQDADIVMFIHKKEDIPGGNQSKELIELMVAKHRNGPHPRHRDGLPERSGPSSTMWLPSSKRSPMDKKFQGFEEGKKKVQRAAGSILQRAAAGHRRSQRTESHRLFIVERLPAG